MALTHKRSALPSLSASLFSRPGTLALRTRLALWRSRRDLAKLDAEALKDVGISAAAARREASLTVWDVPAGWTRR
jgi:uncharacterized protein YjiS (DUF1127 family)